MSMYKVIFVDSQNRITSAENMALRDPCPYMQDEARLQASTPDRANPERFGMDAQPPAEAIDGLWVNCKVVGYAVVPMTQEEIDAREAEKEAERIAKKEADDTRDSDFDNWAKINKAMMKLLVKEINILRVGQSLAPRTKNQVIADLKAGM